MIVFNHELPSETVISRWSFVISPFSNAFTVEWRVIDGQGSWSINSNMTKRPKSSFASNGCIIMNMILDIWNPKYWYMFSCWSFESLNFIQSIISIKSMRFKRRINKKREKKSWEHFTWSRLYFFISSFSIFISIKRFLASYFDASFMMTISW